MGFCAPKANIGGASVCLSISFVCHPNMFVFLCVLNGEGWKLWETWKVIVCAFKVTLRGYLSASDLVQPTVGCPFLGIYSMAKCLTQNSFDLKP